MTARKSRPVPKGRDRWPLDRCWSQFVVLNGMYPGAKYTLAQLQVRLFTLNIHLSPGAVRCALHRLRKRGLVRHSRKFWRRREHRT